MSAIARHAATEHVDKDASKLLAEQTVDEEVDCRVEGKQDVRDAVDVSHEILIVIGVVCEQTQTLGAWSVGRWYARRLTSCNTTPLLCSPRTLL